MIDRQGLCWLDQTQPPVGIAPPRERNSRDGSRPLLTWLGKKAWPLVEAGIPQIQLLVQRGAHRNSGLVPSSIYCIWCNRSRLSRHSARSFMPIRGAKLWYTRSSFRSLSWREVGLASPGKSSSSRPP